MLFGADPSCSRERIVQIIRILLSVSDNPSPKEIYRNALYSVHWHSVEYNDRDRGILNLMREVYNLDTPSLHKELREDIYDDYSHQSLHKLYSDDV